MAISAETALDKTGSIFERIGGEAAVDAAVDLFYRKVLADAHIAQFLDSTDMDDQRAKQKAFLTMAFGGPNSYTGRDLRTAHAGLVAEGLNDSHFDAVAGHLQGTLEELNVPNELIGEVMNIAASTRGDVLAGDGRAPAAAPASGSIALEEYQQMLNDMPVNVMMLELENFTITYVNDTSVKTLTPLEKLLLTRKRTQSRIAFRAASSQERTSGRACTGSGPRPRLPGRPWLHRGLQFWASECVKSARALPSGVLGSTTRPSDSTRTAEHWGH